MTTPFDQQPQPVPPSEGTNDAPEDRANAPTVPNTVPAGQPNVASDGATTTPMTPATASQRPAGAPLSCICGQSATAVPSYSRPADYWRHVYLG